MGGDMGGAGRFLARKRNRQPVGRDLKSRFRDSMLPARVMNPRDAAPCLLQRFDLARYTRPALGCFLSRQDRHN